MKRTQIQLTEQQARALKAQARVEERSVAELVRESVAEYLGKRRSVDTPELLHRARGLKGRFRSGHGDLAEAHDRHLDEAFDR
ncbi:MAG: ribbon-helix-helix protein, CopG family [Gammaproteobacteria bacterium]|nr:ribbon-helix-helix protein, CopG family [Gammaproteobacteria bacterium]MDE0364388.1 ribbon-helix-helix protein, CopG family [Gammaproteobacteria bacterium]